MSRPPLSIITASAGTGKTYRLALEYVRIVLDNFGNGDFSLDNILVLTFTRKATAEIRERIVSHLDLLASDDDRLREDKRQLLAALRPQDPDRELTLNDANRILSVRAAIAADRRNLQVMTIDAYIGSIFRNIVRPLRSISDYDIDQLAVIKRLPHLLDRLMRSDLRQRVDNLLRRRISPSLDDYRGFFASLISNRWLCYLIDSQHGKIPSDSLHYHFRLQDPLLAANSRDQLLEAWRGYLECIVQVHPDAPPEDVFKKKFKDLWPVFPASYPDLMREIEKLCSNSQGCLRLFSIARQESFHNGNKFKAGSMAEIKPVLETYCQSILTSLSDLLVHELVIPEQREILDIWKEVLDIYDNQIYTYRNLTYDDISWFTLEALFKGEEPDLDLRVSSVATEFYMFLSHRSRFILIDEFQDTSLLQFSILKPIIEEITSGEGTREFAGLTVVGDEKQSIFGWRGGERELLLNLNDIFPTLGGEAPEVLRDSYRSSPLMMEFINYVFLHGDIHAFLQARNLAWKYEAVNSKVGKPKFPTQIEFQAQNFKRGNSDESLEAAMRSFVTHTIKPALNCPGQEVAILCRKTNELSQLQNLLEEAGVESIFQPSSILPDHLWVAPLVAWLRFLAFRDWLDFLAVLRSNYIMLKAAPLKNVADAIRISRETASAPDFSAHPVVASLLDLSKTPFASPADACQCLVERFLPDCDPTERDLLNIHAFLSLLREFDLSSAERDKSIPALLDYLDDNRSQEFLKQVAVEGGETLQLLTIHKSKGLQFDRVFVFYNLSGSSGREQDTLKTFVKYASADFQQLEDFALTYHYRDIIAESSFRSLVDEDANRKLLEEMNTLYVAFTRAKTALHVCMAYAGSSELQDYLSSRKESQINLPQMIAGAASSFFSEKQIEPDQNGVFALGDLKPDVPPPQESQEPPATSEDTDLSGILPPLELDPFAGAEPQGIDENLDWKKVWLTERRNLLGDLAHHYLSFLIHNTPEERAAAFGSCLAKFGGSFPHEELLVRLETLRRELPESKIFIPGYDKVFTEFSLFPGGGELRLDRLMLNTREKKALILDFKTGGIHDPLQLERYRQALLELGVIRCENYSVEIEFVKISI